VTYFFVRLYHDNYINNIRKAIPQNVLHLIIDFLMRKVGGQLQDTHME